MNKFFSILLFSLIITSCSNENSLSEKAFEPINGNCYKPHEIKGNRNNSGDWIYHTPRSHYYDMTYAEECFSTIYDAENAGYRGPRR